MDTIHHELAIVHSNLANWQGGGGVASDEKPELYTKLAYLNMELNLNMMLNLQAQFLAGCLDEPRAAAFKFPWQRLVYAALARENLMQLKEMEMGQLCSEACCAAIQNLGEGTLGSAVRAFHIIYTSRSSLQSLGTSFARATAIALKKQEPFLKD